MGSLEAVKIITNKEKLTKIYLKKCRGLKKGCIKQFFTHTPQKQYCSSWCRHESVLESNRLARKKNYHKNKKRENNKHIGTTIERKLKSNITYLGGTKGFIWVCKVVTYLGHNYLVVNKTKNQYDLLFYPEYLRIKKDQRETFLTGNSKGKQKDPTGKVGPSLPYQYITEDDIFQFSISYLKDNQFKCPECGNRTHLIEHALSICSNPECGLVVKAPPIHPGYVVDDLLPIRKIAATVQDFPAIDFSKKGNKKRQPKPVKAIKQAHENAYKKYEQETGHILQLDKGRFNENDPMNPTYWEHYLTKTIKRGKAKTQN